MVRLPTTHRDDLHRHVSISTLPKLSRAGTFEIELHYFMLHLRYGVRKTGKLCKKLAKALRYLPVVPYLPCVCFFILADKLITFMKHGSTEISSDEIIYFPHPECSSDGNFNVVIIETREVEG